MQFSSEIVFQVKKDVAKAINTGLGEDGVESSVWCIIRRH